MSFQGMNSSPFCGRVPDLDLNHVILHLSLFRTTLAVVAGHPRLSLYFLS